MKLKIISALSIVLLLFAYQNCGKSFDAASAKAGLTSASLDYSINSEKVAITQYEELELWVELKASNLSMSWLAKCPEDVDYKTIYAQACGNNMSCVSLICTDVGIAQVKAELIGDGNIVKNLSRSIAINEKLKTEDPAIITGPSLAVVNTAVSLQGIIPGQVLAEIQSSLQFSWQIPSTCTSANLLALNINLSCSSTGVKDILFSYNSKSFFGSASLSINISKIPVSLNFTNPTIMSAGLSYEFRVTTSNAIQTNDIQWQIPTGCNSDVSSGLVTNVICTIEGKKVIKAIVDTATHEANSSVKVNVVDYIWKYSSYDSTAGFPVRSCAFNLNKPCTTLNAKNNCCNYKIVERDGGEPVCLTGAVTCLSR